MMEMDSNDNIIKMANIKIVALNINGMCTVRKQEMLVDFLQRDNIQKHGSDSFGQLIF